MGPFSQPVGIFDSGVGGLTVVREILAQLPCEQIIYFGDTARVPYGPRPPEELLRFADQIAAFLVAQGVKAIVDACNSTSAVALDFLRAKYDLPILGVIEPGIKAALPLVKNRRLGVIATQATIESRAHWQSLAKLQEAVELYGQSCPLFVRLVEAGELYSDRVLEAGNAYLSPLVAKKIDALILGCTHYPFLAPALVQILGPAVKLVDPAIETVKELKSVLAAKGLIRSKGDKAPQHRFYVSGPPERFRRIGMHLLRNASLFVNLKQVLLPSLEAIRA